MNRIKTWTNGPPRTILRRTMKAPMRREKPPERDPSIKLDKLLDVIQRLVGVEPQMMLGRVRQRHVNDARRIAFKILRDDGWTADRIGTAFGGRDHSTILFHYDTATSQMLRDPHYSALVSRVHAECLANG